MRKQRHVISLFGITSDSKLAKPHQASDVVVFRSDDGVFKAAYKNGDKDLGIVVLTTPKGRYELEANNIHATVFMGTCKDTKVHVTLKKIVGQLIYWA